MDKHMGSFRLSAEARKMLASLAANLGVSKTAVLEMAIREFARKHGESD